MKCAASTALSRAHPLGGTVFSLSVPDNATTRRRRFRASAISEVVQIIVRYWVR
jgi:hypothetical protein